MDRVVWHSGDRLDLDHRGRADAVKGDDGVARLAEPLDLGVLDRGI